ncbi:hypothetical protein BC833DRAFT_595159 [Globomyces pollinis-pini]|nr:hypothetical protein BC833DRAFT_595159 [Globomyces pollinis-pini]
MPVYELLMITKKLATKTTQDLIQNRSNNAVQKSLLKYCATFVLDHKGVVRELSSLGNRELPYRMKSHQEIHSYGWYLTMKFDSSPKIMSELSKSLKLNEHVIRHSIVNVGDSLKQVTAHVDLTDIKN